MCSFQALVAILMAAMVHVGYGAHGQGIKAMSVMLATALVDVATSSGFQHSVIAAPGGPLGPGALAVEPSRLELLHRGANDTGSCFHVSNSTVAENDTPVWVP
ncbi:hypothetical protein DHEL01_v202369 [Diaporthe helianthi]|uniref:Uncharacterized protein n=1 Tax=Diaporthe helianthi TaxID=158607 RepID=A0A2P5I9R9_DIAHE|nr:hypothetical protein DHEL01_v202369 [Diaporthe helianthi]